MDGLTILNTAKERISECEDRLIDIIQVEQQRGKKKQINEQRCNNL